MCCKRITKWTTITTDAIIYGERIGGLSTIPPRPSGSWTLKQNKNTSGILPQQIILDKKSGVKIENSIPKNSNQDPNACINTCGGTLIAKNQSPPDIKDIDATFDQCLTNYSWVNCETGKEIPAAVLAEYQIKIQFDARIEFYENEHRCGKDCPPCNDLVDKDETKQLIEAAKDMKPKDSKNDCDPYKGTSHPQNTLPKRSQLKLKTGFKISKIKGSSMYPGLKSGEKIETNLLCELKDVRIGDTIEFIHNNGDGTESYYAHQVVAITRDGLETKGSNNSQKDSGTVNDENFIGCVRKAGKNDYDDSEDCGD